MTRLLLYHLNSITFLNFLSEVTGVPEGRTRKSLALYYFTNGRPAEEVSGKHSTLFKSRSAREFRATPMQHVKRWANELLAFCGHLVHGRGQVPDRGCMARQRPHKRPHGASVSLFQPLRMVPTSGTTPFLHFLQFPRLALAPRVTNTLHMTRVGRCRI